MTYAVTQYSYDLDSRLVCTAVRMNPAAFNSLPSDACTLGPQGNDGPDRITRNVYDDYHAGLLMKIQKAYNVTTANGFPATLQEDYASYSYTLNGKQQTVTDANGNVATYVYDGFDRQVAWRFPSADNGAISALCNIGTIAEVNWVSGPSETRNSTDDCEKYAYDRNGNRATLVKRDGSIIRYSYDALNRVTSKCVTTATSCVMPAAARGRDVYYKYDLGGRQLSASFDSASGGDKISSDYDALGRLTSSTISMGGFTKALSSMYDCAGRRVQLTHPDTQAFSYAYDAANRLTDVSEGAGAMSGCNWTGPATKLDTFAYNPDSTLSRRTEGAIAAPSATVDYTWDGIGRLTNQTDTFPSATGSTVSWAFTSSDPLRKLNPANEIVNESRDNDAYAWRGAFAVNRGYQANGLNQYTTAGTASFTYDANGNLTSDGTNTFLYDAENRLVSATVGGTTTNLTYDPLGRLWQVQKGNVDTRFLYDGDALVAEYDAGGNLINRYVHGSNAATDDPFVWYVGSGTGTKRFLHADHLGSIVAVTNASGAPSINTYDEYGIPGTNNSGRFQYTGQAWLPDLGMYYYKARIYSPTLGRFLQTDPIGYKDQINLYAYVGDDPIAHNDPTGLATVCRSVSNGMHGMHTECHDDGSTLQAQRGGQGKGERGRTGRPEGTDNPWKKYKPGQEPGTREWKDQNGKKKTGPWDEDERRGGDGSGVKPGSKYPDGTPVGSWPERPSSSNSSKLVWGGVAVVGFIGAGVCAAIEPCGAIALGILGLGGTTAAAAAAQ